MTLPPKTLGSLLRHLTEALDGPVEDAYRRAGLDYRPRYTPVVRALQALGPSSIRGLSEHAGLTHSAVSQTVSQMALRNLVELRAGQDGRERIVAPTPTLEAMIPALERQWTATEIAARTLDRDIGASLPDMLRAAIAALERQPFAERLVDVALSQEDHG
jgi:DNA-binding MarR family transcriptional regulator